MHNGVSNGSCFECTCEFVAPGCREMYEQATFIEHMLAAGLRITSVPPKQNATVLLLSKQYEALFSDYAEHQHIR